MRTVTFSLLGALSLAGSPMNAADPQTENPYTKIFASIAAPDYPAKAAAEVKRGEPSKQVAVTALVVRAAVGLRPASAPAVVASISREVPDMASIAAYDAADVQPNQAIAIATAASAAAPTQAGKIVNHVCLIVPSEYRNIALAVAKVAPDAGREILNAVAETTPRLKPGIDIALAKRSGNFDLLTLAATLDWAQDTNRVARAGSPPFTPPGPVPLIPPGGLDYSRP